MMPFKNLQVPPLGDRETPGGGLMRHLHLDQSLMFGIMLLIGVGLLVLYSAGGQSADVMLRQVIRLALALILMLAIAQVPAELYERWAPWLYAAGVILLILVLIIGKVGKGAQRWLDFGVFRFQPSEIMKIAVPMMVAWFLAAGAVPPRLGRIAFAAVMIIVPAMLVALQPDLGTAALIASSGIFVILLAGISWRLIAGISAALAALAPLVWYFMHDYQRQRIITLFNPESDPLGAGYHIIQSKIAIGSGGLYGKGWLNGTQSYLEYIPERSTDFIFAVLAEEFGMMGVITLLAIYLFIISRGIYISTQAQSTYSRLVAGSLTLTFFVYVFVNIGMVSGLLPVVGIPLPIISYGGTSLVTIMCAFGILMSIHTHRKLVSS